MDPDHRELANRLFSLATAALEDAVDAAVQGQHPALTHAASHACAGRLRETARSLAAIAETILVAMPVGQTGEAASSA